jgi:hypothetical protein
MKKLDGFVADLADLNNFTRSYYQVDFFGYSILLLKGFDSFFSNILRKSV